MKENDYNSPSIGDLLIATLTSARNPLLFHKILRERQYKNYKERSVRVALSRLYKKGYLYKSKSGWIISEKGTTKGKQIKLLSYIASPFNKNSPQNTLCAFDIPEESRFIRDWLRSQLKIFGYKMLQQSLWIGPGPLPSPFTERLEKLGIRKNVKTFKITNRR